MPLSPARTRFPARAPAADRAAAAVFTFVLGNVLGPAATASLTRKLRREGSGDVEQAIGEAQAEAREIAAQFPRLRARLDTHSADYGAAPDNTFQIGLQAILDGLEALQHGSTQ
ncbi:TetR/AcrR family transcriptional regulator C-terminal domain-containing protein [Streptomyces sp. NPDC088560]|uniref:TetR/AcrR family transcriptional regulator C-terminal domain-containing protein n=1 Tax=Streptomyces sp. NPDC088560 TaxID=3365868 RepID=UPI0038165383